ncbi:hypothetical protein [Brevundimonas bacteroides]|uniref:hypothetical protein n=1 Tax=Brevundimonas bacteroides TaxID=74311 RepID=UPI001B80C93D|nr:hypothetical protein [Brevundimonas bacteroides]
MVRRAESITLDMGGYALFAMLAGLALLGSIAYAAAESPTCTGPPVERCDYIETAKAANSGPETRPFVRELGFNVFDQGSSVVVQQSFPVDGLVHASAVWIDKKSCQPCEVRFYGHRPPPLPGDRPRGRLIQSVPAEDPTEAARLRAEWLSYGYPVTMDIGSPEERGLAARSN